MNFKALFDPQTIAVIGAHAEEGHVGYALVANLLAEGDGRRIIPVTERFTDVLGLSAVKSINEIEGMIDLAVIAIASEQVAGVLRACGEKHIPAVVIISAGFKEVGGEGVRREEELRQIAHEYDITLIGPNCLGVINANQRMNASFAAGGPPAGGIAFLSQSGAIATSIIDWSRAKGVGFSKVVSLGNEASLTEIELLEYLRDDEDTKAILMYLEHISDGPRFMALLHEIAPTKSVVILRAGRSARGAGAVMSHTGSLAPDDAIFSAATAQSGAITVDTLRDLFSFAMLFQMNIMKPLTRLVVLTNGGGPSVNTADLIDLSRSLSLVQFDERAKESLRAVLPSMAAVGNPVDVIGDAGSKRYDDALQILVGRDDVDAIIAIVTPQMMTNDVDIARVFATHTLQKPIIPAFMGGAAKEEGLAVLREHGLVSFNYPTDAIIALDLLARGIKKVVSEPQSAPLSLAPTLEMCDMETTQSLLASYNIPLSGVFVNNRSELCGACNTFDGSRFALKAISKNVVHKSDAGAVRIGLSGVEEVERAWDDILSSIHAKEPGAHIDGMLLQLMIRGREIIIGMKRDKTFGPVILFGLGGIFVEILKDVTMRIAPVTRDEALAQIRGIKAAKLLSGVRGEERVNEEALADIIVSLSRLALEHPEIAEIDLNPVMATQSGAVIVDARFMKVK